MWFTAWTLSPYTLSNFKSILKIVRGFSEAPFPQTGDIEFDIKVWMKSSVFIENY